MARTITTVTTTAKGRLDIMRALQQAEQFGHTEMSKSAQTERRKR